MPPYNFGTSGNILMKLYQPTCREAGVIGLTCVQFLEVPPLKFGSAKKRPNFGAISDNFRFDREYLRNGWAYQKSEKKLINYSPSQVGQKKPGELWSTYEKVIEVHIDPPKCTFFRTQYFGP